jgi:hypothetical protein
VRWAAGFRALSGPLAAALTLCLSHGYPVLAAPAGAAAQVGRDVSLMENRFFFKLYSHDPVEKRLQRLELLVFGATQGGTNEERAARLKKAVADRDRQAAAGNQAGQGAAAGAGQKKPLGSSQYPVLNTLEWRILKKTYPNETLDQRLERLETRLFGQPSSAMAYADRVERLKRTVGIDVAQSAPSGPLGPKPKARPRSEAPDSQPWTWGSPLLPDFMPPGRYRMPFAEMPPQFSEMFKELDRQMNEMMKLPPGSYRWEFDPDKGEWIERSPGRRPRPLPSPFDTKPFPAEPAPALPPYYDPNST